MCISVRAGSHIQVHTSLLWVDFIPCSHYVLWLLWENSACFWRTCKIPSCCLNSWDAGKAATTHRMYSSTSLGSRVKPDVHIQRNNIWDDWTDWVGGQLEDPPRGTRLMQNWQPHKIFCCRAFLVVAPWCSERKSSSAPSCQEISQLDTPSREDSRYEGWDHCAYGLLQAPGSEGWRIPVYLRICGSKPTPIYPTPTTAFSTDPFKSLLCLWTQVSQLKAEQSSEFTPPVSHALLKAHQSNSSEELTNAAQPTKSGHTRDKDRAFAKAFATAGEPFGSWSGAQMDWKKRKHFVRKVPIENSLRCRGIAKPWPCQNMFTGAKMHSEKNAIHLD